MNGVQPRLLCARTLLRTLESGSYSNLALQAAFQNVKLTGQEKALCTAIFQGTLERLLTVDACVQAHSSRAPEKLDAAVRCVLRCGIYELLYLATPPSATVNLWTEVIKAMGKKSASGMVNAILRSFLRNGKQIPQPKEKLAAYAVQYSVPRALIAQLIKEYGEEKVLPFLEDAGGEPPVYIRRNPQRADTDALLSALADFSPTAIAEIPNAYRLQRSGALTDTEAFKKGMFHVQDLASQLCCMALDAQPGEIILDVCAAPGGKTFTIAEMMRGTGKIYAYDLHENRVRLIQKGAKRLGLANIYASTGDAAKPADDRPMADRVLCDVPCSGYGVMRRKPEVRYKSAEEVKALPAIQRCILEASARAVKPGGVLVYSTCTLSKAENETVVADFLSSHSAFALELPWKSAAWNQNIVAEMTTLFPQMLGSDGFFIAKMRRRAE